MASLLYFTTILIMSIDFHAEAVAFPLSKVFESQGLKGSKNFASDKPQQKLVRKRILHKTNEAPSPESKDIESVRNLEQLDIDSFWYVEMLLIVILFNLYFLCVNVLMPHASCV